MLLILQIFLPAILLEQKNTDDMDDLDFTEEEIREQLEKLGYSNVPASRLAEFKRGEFLIIFLSLFRKLNYILGG